MCQHGCKVCITRMYTCVSTVHIYTYVLHILRMYFTRVFLCMYVYLHGRNTRCVIKCIKWIKKLAPLPAIKHLARNTVFKSETFSSFLCIVNQEQQPMWQLLENISSVKAFYFAMDPTFSALWKINENKNYPHTLDCLEIV